MNPLTRQELQRVVDEAKGRILERTVSKQDMQAVFDAAYSRTAAYLHDYMLQNQQQFFRELKARNTQYVQKLTVLETRMAALEQELRIARQLVNRMAGQKTRPIFVPTPVEPERNANYKVSFNPAN